MPITRRALLSALALSPASLAACSAGGAAARPGVSAPAPAPPPGPAQARPVPPSLERLRAFAVGAGAEPAFTFRASLAKTGGR